MQNFKNLLQNCTFFVDFLYKTDLSVLNTYFKTHLKPVVNLEVAKGPSPSIKILSEILGYTDVQ